MLSTILLKLHGTVARDRQNVRAKANEEFVSGCIKNVWTPNTHNLGLNDETTQKMLEIQCTKNHGTNISH